MILYLFTNVRCSYSLIIYKQKNQIPFCAKIFEYIFLLKKPQDSTTRHLCENE